MALAEQNQIPLSQLSLEQFASLSDKFTEDVLDVFDWENSVEKRNAMGGPCRASIQAQVEHIRAALKDS